MSECKACRSEIDPRASKCPRCQAFQSWYRNPHVYSWILLVPFLMLMFWQTSRLKSENFADYQSQFSVEKVAEHPGASGSRVITYRIKNATGHKWERLSYELVGEDDQGRVVVTTWGSEFSWLVQPHGQALVSVEAKSDAPVASWKFRIADLQTDRF